MLVGIDAVMLPLLLAWPAAEGSRWDDYYKVHAYRRSQGQPDNPACMLAGHSRLLGHRHFHDVPVGHPGSA